MVRINPDEVIWNEVDGNVVALQFSSGAYFTFNEIGSKIWKLLEKGKANDEIVFELRKSYNVPSEKLDCDVKEFIAQTISKGLTCE